MNTTTEGAEMEYRVLPGLFAERSQLAVVRRYSALSEAFGAMGNGIVVDSAGRVVAFHESHAAWLSAGVGNYKV